MANLTVVVRSNACWSLLSAMITAPEQMAGRRMAAGGITLAECYLRAPAELIGTGQMSYTRPPNCLTCGRIAALNVKAEVVRKSVVRVLSPSSRSSQSAASLPSRQRAATDWLLAIDNCLKREAAVHQRCRSCRILMGPGHIETGVGLLCGTCRYTMRGASGVLLVPRPAFGKRGWLRGDRTPP